MIIYTCQYIEFIYYVVKLFNKKRFNNFFDVISWHETKSNAILNFEYRC